MRVAILGTRGIPNHYGGFERLAEQLSFRLVEKGHEVYVYNSHNHSYRLDQWNKVRIIRCFDPEYIFGTAGQFVYDLNCIMDARKRAFDIILMLGYTSSSVWHMFYPRESVIICNMDGLEWQRSKYSKPTKAFLRLAEKLAIAHSDYFVSDSAVIQTYFKTRFNLITECIAYGAEVPDRVDENILESLNVSKREYCLLVSRMEPENNIELVLSGFCFSRTSKKILVVGDASNKYGRYLKNKFRGEERVLFVGPVYDQIRLDSLRRYSFLYFHGHSTGGTNPSLLEAMASQALIAAHDNAFNRAVLGDDAFYFTSATDVKAIVENTNPACSAQSMINHNLDKILRNYNWIDIALQYERFMLQCLNNHVRERNIYHKRYSSQ
jgi:glycosyltransferase involved in cell wall biosynthesis